MPAPLLVHVHIPKCAGTSFNSLLRESFGRRHLDLYLTNPESAHDPATLDAAVRTHPDLVSIASHSIRRFSPRLADREALYVCFLRDPLAWYISNITYLKKNFATLSAEHRALLPSDTPGRSTRSLTAFLLEHGGADPATRNPIVRFLTAHAEPPVTQPLAAARRILEDFFFVGFVDTMDEGRARLSQKLATRDIHLIRKSLPTLNMSAEVRDDLAWLTDPADPVGRASLEWIAADRELYESTRARFA